MAAKTETQPTILVPIDFSDFSEAALVWACRIASCWKTRLNILHVVHDPGSAPGYYAHTKRKKHLHRLEEAAGEMMKDFLEGVRKRHPELSELDRAKQLLVTGLPVSRILEVAAESNAELIVMGSRGRTGLPHLLIGSKAERVVHLAPIPVTIVKSDLNSEAE